MVTYEKPVHENGCKASSGSVAAGNWVLNSVTRTTGIADPFGGTNAFRQSNSSTVEENHRSYIGSNVAYTNSYATVWAKGTAGSFLILFTGGDSQRVDLATGAVMSGNGPLAFNEVVNGWRKIQWKIISVNAGTIQLSMDSPGLSSSFTPPNTTSYVDFCIQLSTLPTALFFPTDGTVFPPTQIIEQSQRDARLLGNRLAQRGVILS